MNSIILLLFVVSLICVVSVLKANPQKGGAHRAHSEPESRENPVLKDPVEEIWPFYARNLLSHLEQVLYFPSELFIGDNYGPRSDRVGATLGASTICRCIKFETDQLLSSLI